MKNLGPSASTIDAAFEAILLATSYMCDYPTGGEKGVQVEIRSTDANIARHLRPP